MSVNLNEFTAEQLVFALQLFNEKIDDINYHIQSLEHLFPVPCDTRVDLELSYNKEFDTAILFKVQITNALNEVKRKDKTLSN